MKEPFGVALLVTHFTTGEANFKSQKVGTHSHKKMLIPLWRDKNGCMTPQVEKCGSEKI